MAFILIALSFAIPFPGICGDVQDDVAITNENISSDTTRTARKSISAGPDVNVGENATVYFHAINDDGSISLKPDFSVRGGSTFRAFIAKIPANLPQPTGTCPDFVEGVISVSPAGNSQPRNVKVWVSDAADRLDGPLVFYWHGTGGSPDEALTGLGPDTIEAIKAEGGIVAAPYHDPEAGIYPWFLTTYPLGTGREDDLLVADEILACAIQKIGIDTGRIHSIGMSAGGLQTAQLSMRRSSYIASVVTYSGGIWDCDSPPPNQDPANKFAAMIFHGWLMI
jgi:predicted esterase